MVSSNDPLEGDRLKPERQRPSGMQHLDVSTPPAAGEDAPQGYGGSGEPPAPPAPPSSGSSSKNLIRLLIVAVLALGGWYFFGRGGASAPTSEQESPMYQKQSLGASTQPATLSAADIDQLRTDGAREAAQRGDPIPGVANPSADFVQQVKDGKVTFYAVRLYDTCFEDGDVVTLRLSSGADVGPIPLTNAGTTISVPIVAGTPPQVTVIGVKDGTGGITVGVQSSGGMWYSGIIPEGGTESMPLAVR